MSAPAIGREKRGTYERMSTAQQPWWPLWQLLGDFVLPRKANISVKRAPGQKQTDRLFDSSGPHDAELLGASLAGALMPPSLKWFSLVMRDEDLNDRKDVRDWLERVRNIALKVLSQSNFGSEILEVLLDLAVFGTGAMLEEEGPAGYVGRFGGVRFRALALPEYVIAEDPFGRVDTLHRKFDMTVRQILARWPETAMQSDKVRTAKENGKTETDLPVLHAVSPRADYAPSRQTGRSKPWASCYLLFDEPDVILKESGFEGFPYMVPRWAKSTNEIYGRSPAYTALPDIRSLNREIELYLAAAGKAIDPTLLVDDDSVIGTLTLEPAGIVTRRPGSTIEPLESKQRFDVAQMLAERLEKKIAEVFFLDALRLRFKPNMTATEVIALQEEMLRLLGPTAGRLHSELLSPIVERTISILAHANQLPPPPAILQQQGADVDIQYQGPLARAQQSADLAAIDRTQTFRERIAQSTQRPDVYDNFDLDEEIRHYALIAGVPANLVKDQDGVMAIRQARAQAAQRQAQLNEAEQMAGAAGKVAPLVKLATQKTPALNGAAA
jgi:hypothetical protein